MTSASANKPYHHGDLRQTLISAACEHLLESGADTLSLRALARKVGVSQTAPYRHFESKSALFTAIAAYGFEMLRDETAAVAAEHPDDPETAIVEIGMAYLSFALKNPEKYQLFFDSSLVDFNDNEELMNAGNSAFDVLTRVIEQGIAQGVFEPRPITQAAATIWSSIHGAASLMLTKGPMMRNLKSQTPVSQAMMQLAQDPRTTVELFVNTLRKPC